MKEININCDKCSRELINKDNVSEQDLANSNDWNIVGQEPNLIYYCDECSYRNDRDKVVLIP